MRLRTMPTKPISETTSSNQGFALIEAIVAMVIFGVLISAMLPLFGAYKITTLKTDSRLGAAAIAQQVMDRLRRATISTLPSSGTVAQMPASLGGQDLSALTYKGKVYQAKITYCDPNTHCDPQYSRQIAVKVYDCHARNDTTGQAICSNPDYDPTFQLETVYTELRN
jgi:prepilin-type N-terminal cleavage/methylation domain-containing protein